MIWFPEKYKNKKEIDDNNKKIIRKGIIKLSNTLKKNLLLFNFLSISFNMFSENLIVSFIFKQSILT